MPQPLTETLLAWYDQSARDLPWRAAGTSAWATLVSEIMLQQTPVARVVPVYQAWLTRWPTPAAQAADGPGEAVRRWGRLGYPRRALRLHECARAIVERFGGEVPSGVDDLLSLPGVGAYTARAVAAFAFGRREPVVDTNVRRVVARAIQGRAAAGPPSTGRDLAAVERLLPVPPQQAARFSAALMELGALVCTARAPACAGCPLLATCAWQRAGAPPEDRPPGRSQHFEGTDRQVRGRLLEVVRASTAPVTRPALDAVWPDAIQRDRALGSLIVDGLIEAHADGRFALPAAHEGDGGRDAEGPDGSRRPALRGRRP